MNTKQMIKPNPRLPRSLCALALSAVALAALAPAAHAQLTYEEYVNVAPLEAGANGPYSLDFQLIQGSDNVSNSVTLSNFVITGGNFTGVSYTAGNESGGVASSVVLSSTAGVPVSFGDNEFAESFSAGTSLIQFKVTETNNAETVAEGSPIADQFNIAVLDTNLNNIETTDSLGNTLFEDPMTGSRSPGQFLEFESNGDDGNPAGVTAVPEPGTYAMLSIGGFAILAWRSRFRRGALGLN